MTMTFTVIVPTFNRPAALRRCLQALQAQDFAGHEIIVVNDGGVAPSLVEFPAIRLLEQPNAGPAQARNAGAAAAQGQYLAFTDDDCAPAPTWLSALAAQFAKTPDAAVGGHTVNALAHDPYAEASQALIDYLYHHYNATGVAQFFTSNNLAFPAAAFRELGGFNTAYTRAAAEDREICHHWRERGYALVYAPHAIVYHHHAMTAATYWRQHFNYGRGARWYHQARSARGQGRPPLEPWTFYGKLLAWPCRHGLNAAAFQQSLLLVISQLAHTAGFLREWAVSK